MTAWAALQTVLAGSRARFLRAADDATGTQRAQLAAIINANRDSVFGREHRFASIGTEQEYREAVPLQSYESLASQQLTADPPIAYERTGGSTAGPKLIPYTRAGLEAIQRAVYAWLDDLLSERPGIARGRCYWSISPAARAPESTPDGIPIGLPSDASYLGEQVERLLADLLVMPAGLTGRDSIDSWRDATIAALCATPDLTFVSVWSPTFWLELLRHIPEEPQCLWPQLDTISCWTSGPSAPFARSLAATFPDTHIQGKGLLATEGVVTIPLLRHPYPVLAVESGYYEFLDPANRVHSASELIDGEEYEVVLTTHSGLYRYRLGDRVVMRGWAGRAPMLEFVSRAETSDLCGEKLSEAFVLSRLDRLKGFRLFTPMVTPRPRYVLFLDAIEYDEPTAESAADQLDQQLCDNPQYEYARRLGQLAPVLAVRLPKAMERYYEYSRAGGRRLGDIKPPGFHPHGEWHEYFPIPVRPRD